MLTLLIRKFSRPGRMNNDLHHSTSLDVMAIVRKKKIKKERSK